MPKRSSTEFSSNDHRESKRVSVSVPVPVPVQGLNENIFCDKCTSSVGSNYPILDVKTLSDDDEVESSRSDIEVVAGDGLQTDIAELRWPDVGWTKEDEVMNWIEMNIVDHNGFLLGEFSRLDQELCIL
ncbi:hypothetical protein QVD17_21015 [Tagetes erecta]|uniref:Uncharacterized protein n=1 Tax=Tagetes erecta TaxID=13708 RepID=A0AAD8KM94_TARER|nr:hypothetical protein QVD17_21015 [Tagetes erecta]